MQNKSDYNDVTLRAYDYLRDGLGYKSVTIRHYRRRWLPLRDFMEAKGITQLDPTACRDFLIGFYGGRPHHDLEENEKLVVKAVSVLKEFIGTGQVIPKRKTLHLDGEIGKAMKDFLELKAARKIKTDTLAKNASHYSTFNLFLASRDVHKISDIDPKGILDFVGALDIRHPAKTHDTLADLRMFFSYLFDTGATVQNLSQYVPSDNYRGGPRLPSCYDESEIVSLLDTVDRGTKLGKRDYAVLAMAARLGLRASDIARLEFSNLHWESSTITLMQYKTQRTVTLPLVANVGNALLDYIQYGRAKSDEKQVFLQAIHPYKGMTPQSVSGMVQRYFKRSGISVKGRRHGCHALRHSLVKELLGQGRPLPVITEVLGHKRTGSAHYYIHIDETKLRQCALDVPGVPTGFYRQEGGVSFL